MAASIFGLACAAYQCTPPRNPLISLPERKYLHSESETISFSSGVSGWKPAKNKTPRVSSARAGRYAGCTESIVANFGDMIEHVIWIRDTQCVPTGYKTAQAPQIACLLPKTVVNAIHQRQRQTVLNELETERLDRIRNPSKYLGK